MRTAFGFDDADPRHRECVVKALRDSVTASQFQQRVTEPRRDVLGWFEGQVDPRQTDVFAMPERVVRQCSRFELAEEQKVGFREKRRVHLPA